MFSEVGEIARLAQPRTEVLTIFVGISTRVGSSKYKPLLMVFVCAILLHAYTSGLNLGIGNNTVHCSLKSCFVEKCIVFGKEESRLIIN